MALGQRQPVIPGVLDQSATRLHQSLLQARRRPVADPVWQHPAQRAPRPQIPQVVGDRAQPQAHPVRPEAVATQPRRLHRLLAFLDSLLCRSPLVVEPHHPTAVRLQVGHDEAHAREQFPEVELHLRHYSPCRLPTCGLIENTLVPDQGLWPGLPTGRVGNSAMPRCRLSLAGMRMAYFTPRSSSAS